MSTPIAVNDYDRVAYPSMTHPQTFAETLAVKGFLRGLDVAPPSRCRVLELGCGDGFNLAAMAIAHPGSTYVGVDYSADAITRGRQIMADLGLTQVRLETGDIRQLDPSLGEFDYIIAHGVYSWVPSEVRDALLRVIGRHLAPHGVGFVSYLALPGAYFREAVRGIMRFHTRTIEDPADKIKQSRAVLALMAKATDEKNHYTQWLNTELAVIEQHTDEGLFHDELSEISAPVLLTEFLDHAARHGLRFLSEAEYLLPVGRALTEEAKQRLRPLEENQVLLEQYLDFIEGRRFRQTLLCRTGLDTPLAYARLDALHVSLSAHPVGDPEVLTGSAPIDYEGPKKASLRATQPAEKAALAALHAAAGETLPYPTMLAATRRRLTAAGLASTDFEPELRRFLIRSAVPTVVELSWGEHCYTRTPPAHPRANPLAHWLLRHGAHTVPSLSGTFVEVNGDLGRFLLTLLDGTRDHPALLAEIRRYLANAHETARLAGEPAPSLPGPDAPELTDQLEKSLHGLAGLGLIFRAAGPAA